MNGFTPRWFEYLKRSLQHHTKWWNVTYDVLAIPLAWCFAFCLREVPLRLMTSPAYSAFALLLLVQLGCYYRFKVYRGLWSFVSPSDVLRITLSVVVTAGIVTLYCLVNSLFPQIPYSVIPLYVFSMIFLLCSGRLSARLLMHHYLQQSNQTHQNKQRVIVVGAGMAGEGIIRDMKRMGHYLPVGLVDDANHKQGLEIHGIRVLGFVKQLPELVQLLNIELIFIAIPSAGSLSMRRIVSYCEQSQVPFRTLPSFHALASGQVTTSALRKVNLEDLLGRDPVHLDWDRITAHVTGKRVLITGGGGSIGSELCRQVLRLNPEKIYILDNCEFNLYEIEREFIAKNEGHRVQVGLNSITDRLAVEQIFLTFKPHIVFHAAAYKHVPLLEEQVVVAVKNNILGSMIIAEASVMAEVDKFVMISTDKAVNPTNIMGVTKRVAEIYCQNLNAQVKTQFITVRFGNVLGSVGSVVPLFQKQLERGGPLTVTHPEMKRYFMTVAEACQLILQSAANGKGGEIFVLDMGEPIKISYLAEQMIRLSGKEIDKDISIEYTGLRPGEKLYEELFHTAEELTQTEHEKIFAAKIRNTDWDQLTKMIEQIEHACQLYDKTALLRLLIALVPEHGLAWQDAVLQETVV